MPTVIVVRGWRLFFYANEGNEPIHIHSRKAESECKYWVFEDSYDIEEAYAHHLNPRLRREIRRIIFEHFDLIVEEWHNFKRLQNDD